MNALEDNVSDILGKAMRGRGFDAQEMASQTGLAPGRVEALLQGTFEEPSARLMAAILGLNPDAVARLGRNEYQPQVTKPANLAQITTYYRDMAVNAYVLWDPDTRDAAIFDTGTDAAPVLEIIERQELEVVSIFLTHSHADHVQALGALTAALDVEAWSSTFEPLPGTRTFRPGDFFNAGQHFIRTRHTPGHTSGGTTFVIEGSTLDAAVVGDALFAGSIGGVKKDYPESLEGIRREILTLPDSTIICPGHGPMTTVALEKANNPFF
ncbi:MAG: Zn-dependent hydrolase, glyoxylase family [Verrucomicrobiota bacterium]|jgi:glyoxylase-like metal-dependent hydrolase (beta-lactamase superfamily II)